MREYDNSNIRNQSIMCIEFLKHSSESFIISWYTIPL